MAALDARIAAGFSRVGAQIKAMMPRLVPAGGTAGQVLTKGSSADYNTTWTTPAAGGGGGGLTADQADDIARLAVIRYGVK